MADLATTADLAARLGRALTATETTRAAPYLADASARIRGWTGYNFEEVAGDVVRLRPVGMKIRLPRRPVTAVNSVTAIGWAGVASLVLPVGAWGWDGIDIIEIAPLSSRTWVNLPDYDLGNDLPDTYEIDYDHSSDDVPDGVVGVCCDMVNRVLLAPSMTEGMNTERIGQYSYGMQQGGGGSPGASVKLTEIDKDALRDLGYGKRTATTVQVTL